MMGVVVIGGHASGVGKTGAICSLIRAMPERRWTAIKVTQCSHGDAGRPCDCELDGREFAISEEAYGSTPPKRSSSGAPDGTDTARYLAAGAVRALWVRTLPGHMGGAMPRIEEEIAYAENVAIESNAVMEFLRPDVYAMVVAPDVEDFKPSARRYLDRADAILSVETRKAEAERWLEAVERRMNEVPRFSVDPIRYDSPEFFAFVRRRLERRTLKPA